MATLTNYKGLEVVDPDPTGAGGAAIQDNFKKLIDWQYAVIDKDLATPPGSPSTGDRYVIPSGATGAWAGNVGDITEYDGSNWQFLEPAVGFPVYVTDEQLLYYWNGTAWESLSGSPAGSDTQVQFNDGGDFGGNANLTYDKSATALSVDNLKLDGNTISSTDTNGSVIVAPNGTGAIQADSGGNQRGVGAVDFQAVRNASTQVASGAYSFIANGVQNTASGFAAYAEGLEVVSSGVGAHAEGQYSTASGFAAHAEGSGTASGGSSHAEGSSTTASGGQSHAEGISCQATATASHAGGYQSKAHLQGQLARSSGNPYSHVGAFQSTITQLAGTTFNATAAELTLQGATPAADTRFVLIDGQTLACFVNIVGRKEGGGANDHSMFLRQVLIRREGMTTQLVGSVQTIGTDINPAGWGGVTITADDTNESLKIEVIGAVSTDIRWMATVMASEVADAAI